MNITSVYIVRKSEIYSRYTQAVRATIYGDVGINEKFVLEGFLLFSFSKTMIKKCVLKLSNRRIDNAVGVVIFIKEGLVIGTTKNALTIFGHKITCKIFSIFDLLHVVLFDNIYSKTPFQQQRKAVPSCQKY